MIQSIQYRKAHFLGEQQWRIQPSDRLSSKDSSQKLYEHGFTLGELAEEADILRKQGISQQDCLKYLDLFSDVDSKLDDWYQEYFDTSPVPLYWLNNSDPRCRQEPWSSTRIPYTFPSFQVANAIMKYRALKIVASILITTICGEYNASSSSNDRPREKVADSIVGGFADKYNQSERVNLAINIVRAMPYFLDNGMGLFGAQRSLFSLRSALYILLQHPGQDLDLCKTLYHQLTEKKGLGYAREIAKVSGGYSRNNSPSASPGITAKDLPYRVQPIDRPSDGSSGSASS